MHIIKHLVQKIKTKSAMNLIFPYLCVVMIHFLSLIYYVKPNSLDRVALLAIKSRITLDPHGVLNSWNDSLPICKWQGVTCGTKHPHPHPHRVVGLDLSSKDLAGTLSPYVGNLSSLHRINLHNNFFGGDIPPHIGQLFRLRYLGLSDNNFEGQIPANISRCLNLKILILGSNRLSGTIPSQLGLLSNLIDLSIHKNHLTGDLLNAVAMKMNSLQTLSAGLNSFQGTIPENIGASFQNLSYFSIGGNNFSGTIPSSFYNLSHLQVVDLSFNQLQGTLPLDIGFRLPHLTILHVGNNSFHGNLPASLSNLTQLVNLSFYYNNFTGKFVFDANNMPDLKILDISKNFLGTGEADDLSFLQSLFNCSHLITLGLESNNMGGILPDYLGNLSTTLEELDLGTNQIYGSIPLGLFNLVGLRRINLQGNLLSGHLSPQIGKLTKLEIFSCIGNRLTGSIPDSIGNLSRLSSLWLGENNFNGMIPPSLGQCTNLLDLYLSQNNLTGLVPPQLFLSSSTLIYFYLDRNQLQGVIPEEISQIKDLVEFVIHENGFSGELPGSLGSCTAVDVIDVGANFFTGSIPDSFKSLTSLSYLNLANNNLSGQIPNFLSKFPLMTIDLSFNSFQGEVPTKGAFANLSALNISGNNQLCGGVPNLHLPRCLPKSTSDNRGSINKGNKLSSAEIVTISIASLVVSVSILSLVYFLLCSRRKQNKLSHGSGMSLKEPFSKVSYDMLLKATDSFSEANLLSAGHFGSVYKGVLDPESNMVVAIKVISLEQRGATKSFMAECEALRSIRHRNLLKIVTVCSSTDFQGNDFKALVYEYMTNGSLHQWIHNDPNLTTLSLLQRVEIAIDVASALDYLHNDCDEPIIHCDLKPSNILLDDDMVAHVGDFGLARFHLRASANNSSSAAVKGTVGYAAPEYGVGSMVSKEGDVYSYGIVLLELMTSKNPTDRMFEGGLGLHNYAKSATMPNQLINIIDPRLLDNDVGNASEGNEGEVLAENERKMKCIRSVVEIGVKCSVESPQDRMRIEDAIEELQVTRDVLLKELHIIRAMHIRRDLAS